MAETTRDSGGCSLPRFAVSGFSRNSRTPIAALADRLIAAFRDRGEVELIGDFITPFSVGVLATVVGLPHSDIDRFRAWYSALLRFGINLIGDPEVTRAGFAARDELDAYLRPLVADTGDPPAPDCCPCWLRPKSRVSN